MPRYVYRPSWLARLFGVALGFIALYLVLFFLAYLADHFLTAAAPFFLVAGLGYGVFALVRRSRDR
ncbi:hypothetical protein I6A60_40990 [Frankia sp. AgB1.9]|uniref:hypothetical protein n=1 Tax=unclassified Frankia TaxID=2632575 RepID=UPI0019339E5B|nr:MULTISPECIES: hypothetical protein [unclassified Frankia]MBL7489193.1 hypothetical protein [Frankia sp. AgW1.1]MBL7554155.1 hypothetical protein [Frankia sp. AgB1.9]MBL7618524.1 hypothetical protein [Frankia sp. AgB1.8]